MMCSATVLKKTARGLLRGVVLTITRSAPDSRMKASMPTIFSEVSTRVYATSISAAFWPNGFRVVLAP